MTIAMIKEETMTYIQTTRVRSHEKGLLFKNGEFRAILDTGRHWLLGFDRNTRIDIASQRDPWLRHPDLDLIIRSGALQDQAQTLDLKDHERALVWIDNRFARILGPGQHALWTAFREVSSQIIDCRPGRFEHPEAHTILRSPGAEAFLDSFVVEEGFAGLLFKDGEYQQTFGPGRYLFWKDVGRISFRTVDMREALLDIQGQELMTADKVTLRLNAGVAFRIVDARRAVCARDNVAQALYREAQLALREVIGACELDTLLGSKDQLAQELEQILRRRTAEFGLQITTLGIRDLILPGEMKELLNRVIEAKKAAEANLIVRREETAAMRSQANTARLLENNPTLMRLRELEILEKVAGSSKMQVILGEKGLAERVVNLL